MIKPRINIWVEMDDEVVLSVWRVRLLEHIRETGSITAAAKIMDVPYRRAWERIQEIESRLGFALLDTEVGGEGGGGAKLTSRAEDLIQRFHRFVDGIDDEIEGRFQRAFGDALESWVESDEAVDRAEDPGKDGS
jgi:molybdate transport system regulatory protein